MTEKMFRLAGRHELNASEAIGITEVSYYVHSDKKTESNFKADCKRALVEAKDLSVGFDFPQFSEKWFKFILVRHYGYLEVGIFKNNGL